MEQELDIHIKLRFDPILGGKAKAAFKLLADKKPVETLSASVALAVVRALNLYERKMLDKFELALKNERH